MANLVYANFILESKLTDLLNTKLNTRSLMTIDTDLVENAGMKKVINVYNYTGAVEDVAQGAGNTIKGAVSFTPAEYEVKVGQQTFEYFDEQAMTDPKVVDMGIQGASQVMVNDLNTKFFAELGKATLEHEYDVAFTYDAVVDALELLNLEEESNLVLILGVDLRTAVRKDENFMAARQGEILFNGQIGSVAGVPVVISKLVPSTEAFLMEKGAVTLFVKKDSEVEQEREGEIRNNRVIMRKVALVALTDATKVVKIVKATV